MKEYIKKDDIAKNGGIIFLASLISGVLSYLYQVFIGRTLGPEEYGVFGALFAIFYLIGIISSTLGTSTTRFVSKFTSDGKNIGFFINIIGKQVVIIGSIFLIVIILLKEQISDFLKLNDSWPVLVLGVILFMSWIHPIFDGSLRGLKKFTILGISGIINTFCKLVFGVLLVMLGLGVSGALGGLIVGGIISLLISIKYIKPHMIPNNPYDPEFNYKEFYNYSIPTLLAMMSLSIPGNIDVILAKYFFSPVDAGLYTSVSVLGKIIYFFPGAIGTVMFPMIVEKKENRAKLLTKCLSYVGILSGFLTLIYIFLPGYVIDVFGNKYSGAIDLVGIYGVMMFLFSLIAILVNYHLAIKDLRYISMFIGFVIIEIVSLLIFHSSMYEMVKVLLVINISFMIISIIYRSYDRINRTTH